MATRDSLSEVCQLDSFIRRKFQTNESNFAYLPAFYSLFLAHPPPIYQRS